MMIKNTVSSTGSAASANITVPSSVNDGDWLVLFIHSNYSLSALGGLAFVEVYKSNTNYRGLYVGYRQASANDSGVMLSVTFAGSEAYCSKLYVVDGTSVGSIAGGIGIASSNTVNHSISYSFSAGQEVLLSASNRANNTLSFNQGAEIERAAYNSGVDLYIASTNSSPTSPVSVSGSGSMGAVLGFVVFNDINHKPPLETLTFNYTGAVQPHIFEPGKYRIKCYGAQGGYRSTPANGGQGGYAEGLLILTEPIKAYIYVGGSGNTSGQSGGFNGGGIRTNNLPGGGGASDIRLGIDSLYARVIVAGGGGSDGASNKPGGNGGGITGVSRTESYGSGGGGATQTAGGAGGNNNSGSFGLGGEGQYRSSGYGGAGGGGWYGGGGVYPDGSGDDDRGGGGGSGYVLTADSEKPSGYLLGAEFFLTETILAQGGHNGDGLVVIEVIETGKQKYLARDNNGVKAWDGEGWKYISDKASEELFLEHGTDNLPLSVNGLLDDAEILLWTDRAKVLSEPERFVLRLTSCISAPSQTITQTVPFELSDGAAVSRVAIVTDEQNGGAVSGEYAINEKGIAFTYTLNKPTAESVAGLKKINIYFAEGTR